MTMTPEIEKLKALAEAATKGEWYYDPWDNCTVCAPSEGIVCVTQSRSGDDAAFIAAANPQTVLALISELAALKGVGTLNDKVWSNGARKFVLGDAVRKKTGSMWRGLVVGFYSTDLTENGYCVESELEMGSVQLYPEAALELRPTPAKEG